MKEEVPRKTNRTPFKSLARFTALLCLHSFLWSASFALRAEVPEVSNVRVSQREGTKLIDVRYDVNYTGPDETLTVWIDVSGDAGRSYVIPARTFSGDVGPGVTPGTDKHLVWDMGADFDGVLLEEAKVRVTAHAGSVPIAPQGMVLIPGGHFHMGEPGPGGRDVYISPFFMDRYEVTGLLYGGVWAWARENGYGFRHANWRGSTHPAQEVSWYDAVRWCNARSEMEGLTPVYYTDTEHQNVYRSGAADLTNAMVKWDANGYRLPTEAEWEKAARGGLQGKNYPWGDEIDGTKANYVQSTHPWTDQNARTTPVGYYNGNQSDDGPDMANGYGLYDMAGNVWEWCWDWSSSQPFGNRDPRGPNSREKRLLRGGSWANGTGSLRCARRIDDDPNDATNGYQFGFRCARGL